MVWAITVEDKQNENANINVAVNLEIIELFFMGVALFNGVVSIH